MPSNSRLPAFIALIAAAAIWGATGAIMKFTLLTVPPFTLALIRFSLAALLLYPLVFRHLQVQAKDLPKIITAGLLGIGIHIGAFFWGLKLTTALNAGIIVSTIPMFTLLSAHFFLKEKIKKNFIAAFLFGATGIILIVGKDFGSGFSLSPLGDLLILFSMMTFVIYETLTKKLFTTYKPGVITWYSFIVGCFFFLPFALYESLTVADWTRNLTPAVIGGILYGIFFSSLGAYSLWEWGLSKISESRVGFFFYLDPIVSTIAAVLLLSEKITTPFVIGAALIFVGIFVAEGHLPYHHLHKLKH